MVYRMPQIRHTSLLNTFWNRLIEKEQPLVTIFHHVTMHVFLPVSLSAACRSPAGFTQPQMSPGLNPDIDDISGCCETGIHAE